jgi:hypothetical protein
MTGDLLESNKGKNTLGAMGNSSRACEGSQKCLSRCTVLGRQGIATGIITPEHTRTPTADPKAMGGLVYLYWSSQRRHNGLLSEE